MEEHNNDETAGTPGAGSLVLLLPSAISANRDPCRGDADASTPPSRPYAGGGDDDGPLFPLESLFWCQPISSDIGSPDYYNDSDDRR